MARTAQRIANVQFGRERTTPLVGAGVPDVGPAIGWARLWAPSNDRLGVLCELADRAPRVTQGYGGWDEVDRAGRVALTTHRGYKPFGIELFLWLDAFKEGTSVEPAIAALEAMAGRGDEAKAGEPPPLAVDTAGVMPHDYKANRSRRWIINDLDVDDETVEVNDYGNRMRAEITVSLLQYVTDSGLETQTTAARQRMKAASKAKRSYTVKSGDTLVSIARRQLGDAGRWKEIADLNGIRGASERLKPKTRLRLP